MIEFVGMKKRIKNLIISIFQTLGDCLVPIMPILIGAGMLNVVLILLGPQALKLLAYEDNTYIVLKFVADSGFYFMPVFVSVASAEKFKTNKYIAALCGAMLLAPQFVEYLNNGYQLSVFGLPITMASYGNQIVPSILLVFILSYIEKLAIKISPENLKSVLVPLICLLLMIPISFSIVGPIALIISDSLVGFFLMLRKLGPFGNGLMCAMIPFFVMFGVGGAIPSAQLAILTQGPDPILYFSTILFNTILGFVMLGIYVIDKDSNKLGAAITATVGGTSEPAIFGTVIKDNKALISLVIADFVASFYAGLMGVKTFTVASFGILGCIVTIGPGSSFLHALIAIIIGCATAFVLSYITHKK